MQRAVLFVKKNCKSYSESVASFVEEGIVRRELSDNFCHYNPNYDKHYNVHNSFHDTVIYNTIDNLVDDYEAY